MEIRTQNVSLYQCRHCWCLGQRTCYWSCAVIRLHVHLCGPQHSSEDLPISHRMRRTTSNDFGCVLWICNVAASIQWRTASATREFNRSELKCGNTPQMVSLVRRTGVTDFTADEVWLVVQWNPDAYWTDSNGALLGKKPFLACVFGLRPQY